MSAETETLHASAVAIDGKGCLILGASGSGKSTLAIELIALGADLIADDLIRLSARDGQVLLNAPRRMQAVIEARGIGLLKLSACIPVAPCHLVVDMDHGAKRLPTARFRDLLGISCPVIFGKNRAGLASIVSVMLRSAELLDPEAPM